MSQNTRERIFYNVNLTKLLTKASKGIILMSMKR